MGIGTLTVGYSYLMFIYKIWDKQTNRQTNRQTDRQTDKQTDTTMYRVAPQLKTVVLGGGYCMVVGLKSEFEC